MDSTYAPPQDPIGYIPNFTVEPIIKFIFSGVPLISPPPRISPHLPDNATINCNSFAVDAFTHVYSN